MKFKDCLYKARQASLRPILILLLVTVGIRVRPAWASVNVGTSVGPQGGTVRSLVVNPQDPHTLYAGTYKPGVFKSIDGGANWIYSGLAGFRVNNLAIDSQ